jgi:phosphatidylglycerophosphatase A
MTISAPSQPLPLPATSLDRLLNVLASGLGLGYFPWGPGTAGSLLGPPLAWALSADGTHPWLAVGLGIAAFLLGIPICNAGIRVFRAKDPSRVVFDEIAAFFWVYLFVPITPMTAVTGFLLSRFFDILKPWPIRRLEWLPRGLGVMADDTLAGLMAGGILGILWRFIS